MRGVLIIAILLAVSCGAIRLAAGPGLDALAPTVLMAGGSTMLLLVFALVRDRRTVETVNAAAAADPRHDAVSGGADLASGLDRRRRAFVRAALDAVDDAVVVTNAGDEPVVYNRAAARMLGLPADEDRGESPALGGPAEGLSRLVADVREQGPNAQPRDIEFNLCPDGTLVTAGEDSLATQRRLRATASCIDDGDGAVVGVVTVVHDLTDERRTASHQSELMTRTCHELRTPLASIRAYVEMLDDAAIDDFEGRNEFSRIIQTETERLVRVVDRMLSIGRLEGAPFQIEPEVIALGEQVRRAVRSVDPGLRERALSLTVDADDDVRVEGERDLLHQLLVNLLSNAIKYTPVGGAIIVRVEDDDLSRTAMLTVRDTGVGIPAEAMPRLFEKFYRTDSSRRMAGGVGLGLSFCRHIVETVHGGRIEVESTLGRGTTVRCTLPWRHRRTPAAGPRPLEIAR